MSGNRLAALSGVCVCGLLGSLLLSYPSHAADFYSGKTIRMSNHSEPGGGYDTYLRLLARHMGQHIPGRPNIIVVNMPGAGGLLEANYAGINAPQDGTFLSLLSQALPMLQETGEPGLHVSLAKFHWIGNLSASNNITVTWYKSNIKTIDDARKRVVRMAGSGAGSISATLPLLLNYLFDTRFKPIIGYRSGGAMKLAMERGEVDGRSIDTWASYKATEANDIANHRLNVILQIGPKKDPELPKAPLLTDLARSNPDHLAVAQFLTDSITATRPLAAPPGVPADRIAILRKAFDETMDDPAFLADAKKIGADISPMSGAQLQKIMDKVFSTSPRVISLFKKATMQAD